MKTDFHSGGNKTLIFFAICALGISSIITQLTLMRELLSVFSGNEMVLGIVLGNWLLLTGLGSYLGKTATKLKSPLSALIVAEILVAVLPIGNVLLVRILRNAVFIRGAMVGVTATVVSCFVLLLPYCVISGYLLTLACCVLASEEGALSIGRVYFMDNIGDIAGGLLFTFVLIYLFNHFGILYVPAFLNLLFAIVVSLSLRKRFLLGAAAGVTVGLAALLLALDLDDVSTRIEYQGRDVVYREDSPYGNLVVTESAGQFDFIENGVPLFSTHNIEEVEETVHYAMCQRPDAYGVLLISGGISGTAKEILKYGVERVDYVELDPLIVKVGQKYVPKNLADERINVINADGRLFVKRTQKRYDAVIADLPDPSTSQINRFYTFEFFAEVKETLTKEGVLSLSLGHYENYLSKELARLIATAHRTLKKVFDNVLIIPGGRTFFLASDGPLYSDIAARIEQTGVQTQLVNRAYLSAMLTPDRLADMDRAISEKAVVNKDFSPVLYYYHLLYWISQFKVRFGILGGVLLLAFAVYLFRIRAVPFAIFTTGFAASSLEVVLLVGFQILYGYVYNQLGLIVTMFMLGLAVGSFVMNRMLPRRSRRDLVKLEFSIAVYAGLLPFILMGLGHASGEVVYSLSAKVVFPLLTLGLGALVGMEFPLAGKADFERIASTAARLYTADFVGACLGAILVSTILIPVMGMVTVCLIVAGLNILSGVIVLLKGKV
ncbi:fused MFS/spermidine synthase [bacterium]|nr:fused MFS/spermidine synthase [bacterium]